MKSMNFFFFECCTYEWITQFGSQLLISYNLRKKCFGLKYIIFGHKNFYFRVYVSQLHNIINNEEQNRQKET